MNQWKKIVLVLTCIGVALGGTFSYLMMDVKRGLNTPESWQAFSPQDDRFDIKFPLDPKESQEQMNIANTNLEFRKLSAEHGDTLYAVSYLDFPSRWKWLGSKKLLTKSFEMIMANESNIEEILHHQLTHHNGDPALNYKVKQDGKEISGKFIISGNTLYRVAVTYPLAAAEKVEPQGFIDSFEVKG